MSNPCSETECISQGNEMIRRCPRFRVSLLKEVVRHTTKFCFSEPVYSIDAISILQVSLLNTVGHFLFWKHFSFYCIIDFISQTLRVLGGICSSLDSHLC